MPATHYLKTWPAFWEAVERGDKTFEVRKNDRAFQTGDLLVLEYFDPDNPPCQWPIANTRQPIYRRVTFVLPGGEFGIEPGYVVMGITEAEAI
jgi:hypothetical protein